MRTGYFWDERCFWHSGGNYAFTAPVGGLVQPLAGGLPENPETKRRLNNLLHATGLWSVLRTTSAPPATFDQLARVHPASYLRRFQDASAAGGGELGLRAPFGPDGYDLAALSAGLAIGAVESVLSGQFDNAYALSRPPGHHCLPDWPNGFCLLANIAIAVEHALATGLCGRVAVLDWDVHHGNGTEAIFYDRDDVLTVSLHQDRNYPLDTGDASDRGVGAGLGYNVNIPLSPGAGHQSFVDALDKIALPALERFAPDIIIVACGYDAAAVDPLSRTLATAQTFSAMTQAVMTLADDLCDGRVVLVHEGGYSEVYVPFCGHAALTTLTQSAIAAPDPFAETFAARQPHGAFARFLHDEVEDLAAFHRTQP